MNAIHISSKNREEINKIIISAKERGSGVLYYDALRILRLSGASVITSYLALNSQEVMIFSSQVEPPIVLKKIQYDRILDGGIEVHKGLNSTMEVLDVALGSVDMIEGFAFLIQETAPHDLKLRIISDKQEMKIIDVKNAVDILLPSILNVEQLLSQKDTLKTFLFNATETEEYDIKALGMLLLILSSIRSLFDSISRIDVGSLFLYREGLGYIITDAFIYLK
ncbi:MAG: hypothetical protein ACP5KG_00525 [Myxococcota bacterium]